MFFMFMADYSIIKNKKLRKLVESSDSMQSLPKAELEDMVIRISEMPKEGQAELIEVLEKEKVEVAGELSDEDRKRIIENIDKLKIIKKKLEVDIRKEREHEERGKTGKAAEKLLTELDE